MRDGWRKMKCWWMMREEKEEREEVRGETEKKRIENEKEEG